MAMRKLSGEDGIRLYVGKLSDNTDEFNMRYSAELSGAQRVDSMCELIRQHFKMKGIDLDARRLD